MKLLRPDQRIFKYLRTGAGGVGTHDMNVDGSSTPVQFRYTATKIIALFRINIVLIDTAMQYGKLGAITTTGHDGILLAWHNEADDVLLDFLDTQGAENNLRDNEDFGALAGVDNIIHPAAGPDSNPARWTHPRGGGASLMYPGEYIQATIREDYRTLDKFRMAFQGVIVDQSDAVTTPKRGTY